VGGRSPPHLISAQGSWNLPLTIEVAAIDDDVAGGDAEFELQFSLTSTDEAYETFVLGPQQVRRVDNDVAGFTTDAPSNGIETHELGTTDRVRVRLTSEPVATVTLHAASNDVTEARVMTRDLTFTAANWDVLQPVEVQGQPDGIPDRDTQYKITLSGSSADAAYAAEQEIIAGVNRDLVVTPVVVESGEGKLSFDGRWLAFDSAESTLVPHDTNDQRDVFVFDRDDETIERVSERLAGTAVIHTDALSSRPSIAGEGSHVAFESRATNLVTVSTPPDTLQAYVADRWSGDVTLVSQLNGVAANKHVSRARVSGDARFVTFVTTADNLGVAATASSNSQLYLWDRTKPDALTLLSNAALGTAAATPVGANRSCSYEGSFTANGHEVVFVCPATDLMPDVVSEANHGALPIVGAVFVFDVQAGTLERLVLGSEWTQRERTAIRAAISGDGRFVAFVSSIPSFSSEKRDIYLHDRDTGETKVVSRGHDGSESDDSSWSVEISDDGNLVTFQSFATNLIQRDENRVGDVFVYDRTRDAIRRVSVSPSGGELDGASRSPALSGDGRVVAYLTGATNIGSGALSTSRLVSVEIDPEFWEIDQ
jgi:hypothetical protein